VSNGGLISSQRPSKGSGGPSQPQDAAAAAAAAQDAGADGEAAAPLTAAYALDVMQRALVGQPGVPATAVAARLVALAASLSPTGDVPTQLLGALGCLGPGSCPAATAAAAADAAPSKQQRLQALLLLLEAFAAPPMQCAALVACLGQVVVQWLHDTAAHPEQLPQVLRALLLALTAATASIAHNAGNTQTHMRVWQDARDVMQVRRLACGSESVDMCMWRQAGCMHTPVMGKAVACSCVLVLTPRPVRVLHCCWPLLAPPQGHNSLHSNSVSEDAPEALLASTAVAWLALTRLMGWGGSAAANAAVGHTKAACASQEPSAAAAGVLLLPLLTVLQQLHYSESQQVFVTAAAASGRRQGPAAGGEVQDGAVMSLELLQALMQALQDSRACHDAPVVCMARLQALSQLLQLCARGVRASAVGCAMVAATAGVAQLQQEAGGPASPVPLGSALQLAGMFSAPDLLGLQSQAPLVPDSDAAGSSSKGVQLPPLLEMMPVLQPALEAAAQPSLQVAALQLLHSYVAAAGSSQLLSGCERQLQAALGLISSQAHAVRDAALSLVPLSLRPAVLATCWGGAAPAGAAQAVLLATQAAADGDDAAAVLASMPQRQLLDQLQALLESAGAVPAGATAAAATEALVAAKTSLLRAVAGLYRELAGSGCEEQPLLLLLRQVSGQHTQVWARRCPWRWGGAHSVGPALFVSQALATSAWARRMRACRCVRWRWSCCSTWRCSTLPAGSSGTCCWRAQRVWRC
jgi:hypothetical protein